MRSVRVSVPGKLILIGEHAVVYGRPALAAAIDRRLSVTFRPTGSGGVSLTLPGIAHAEQTSWVAIAEHAERSFSAWARFDGEPNADFAAVRGTEAAHLVKVALGAALSRSGLSPRELPDATIDISSELPVGSGFGSSAAAAVGVLAAFEAAMGSASADREGLLAAALDVERCQHGRPSGIDTETVVRGGLVWAERAAEAPGRLAFSNLSPFSPLLSALAVYDTGRPREATGEVVAAVAWVRDRDPRCFDETLDRFERATRAFKAEIEAHSGTLRRLIDCVREAEACLEAMGAVPEAVARRVRTIEAAGGAAKISGAGAASGEAAGSLLVIVPEPGEEIAAALGGWTRREVVLGAHGLMIEEPA
jgi:mevalonate kinase